MGRKEIEGLDEKLIQATFEVAGNSPRGTFSTKEIGIRCGVSEFTVFDHFKSKENLIDVCNQRIYDDFHEADLEAHRLYSKEPKKFFNYLLDRFLEKPAMVRFAGNYCLVFPREGSLDKYDDFYQMTIKRFAETDPIVKIADNTNEVAFIVFLLQELLQDALFIISGEVKDTPENRSVMYKLVFEGVEEFIKLK
jgi:AcrR family transcriptional regulator